MIRTRRKSRTACPQPTLPRIPSRGDSISRPRDFQTCVAADVVAPTPGRRGTDAPVGAQQCGSPWRYDRTPAHLIVAPTNVSAPTAWKREPKPKS
jgi:hypothetical protein